MEKIANSVPLLVVAGMMGVGIARKQMWIAARWRCLWAQNRVYTAGLLASVVSAWWWSRKIAIRHFLRIVVTELAVVAVCIGAILAGNLEAHARVKDFVPRVGVGCGLKPAAPIQACR